MFGLKDFQAAAIVGTWLREGFGSGYPDVKQGGKEVLQHMMHLVHPDMDLLSGQILRVVVQMID